MPDSKSAGDSWQYKPGREVPPGEQLPAGVHRIALGVEYDGSPYCGWQKQHHSPSVQAPLEAALAHIANEPVQVVCAGRTDTGVHGCGQVVHFDTCRERSEWNWVMGVNSALAHSIAVTWATEVEGQFHARFSARSRTYRYVIANTSYRPALMSGGMSWVRGPLDDESMGRALALLEGTHDFTAYRGAGCRAGSATRCIQSTRVFRRNNLVIIEISANAFLLHMVRNIVGQLLEVGRGKAPESEMARVLGLRDRTRAGVAAPPQGLYLVKVGYPERFGLPEQSVGPEFLKSCSGY